MALLAVGATVVAADATNGNPINKGSQGKYTVAVIGDNPYGTAKIEDFPGFIDFVNDDPKVDLVAHVGDIKSGSTVCSDEYFEWVKGEFDRLQKTRWSSPLATTNGLTATERTMEATTRWSVLALLRTVFFPEAGEASGDAPRPS